MEEVCAHCSDVCVIGDRPLLCSWQDLKKEVGLVMLTQSTEHRGNVVLSLKAVENHVHMINTDESIFNNHKTENIFMYGHTYFCPRTLCQIVFHYQLSWPHVGHRSLWQRWRHSGVAVVLCKKAVTVWEWDKWKRRVIRQRVHIDVVYWFWRYVISLTLLGLVSQSPLSD